METKKSKPGGAERQAVCDASLPEEYRGLKSQSTGQILVELLRNSHLRAISMDRAGMHSPVRDVEL
jgi:hypothetical protein